MGGHIHAVTGATLEASNPAVSTTENTTARSMMMRRLAVWLVAVVPVVVLLGGGMYYGVQLQDCSSCHTEHEFTSATMASSHASVECGSCHGANGPVGRLNFAISHLGQMVTGSAETKRDVASVSNANCLSCHDQVIAQPVTASGINIDHALCAENTACTDCHSAVAHGEQTSWLRVYDMETCLSCHAKQAATNCDLCHAGRRPANRIASGVFAVTHGPQWEKTHGMGDSATCSVCHTAATCESCHGVGLPHDANFMKEHSTFATDDKAKCSSCHTERFCSDCHGLAMPHPNKFVREHAQEARDDRELCNRCHVSSDCMTCHEKHVHPGGAIGALTGTSGGGER